MGSFFVNVEFGNWDREFEEYFTMNGEKHNERREKNENLDMGIAVGVNAGLENHFVVRWREIRWVPQGALTRPWASLENHFVVTTEVGGFRL